MSVCNVMKYNVNLMAFKTQAIIYYTNLVNLFKKSVARLLELATLSETASLVSSSLSWDSELQQKQWLSLRFYIPVRRVTIPGYCQYIQRQIHARRESHMEAGMRAVSSLLTYCTSFCSQPSCHHRAVRQLCLKSFPNHWLDHDWTEGG